MTALEKIVVDLEMAKELQKSGIDFGETAFVWVIDTLLAKEYPKLILRSNKFAIRKKGDGYKTIPAPTTNELLDLLPHLIETKNNKHTFYDLHIKKLETVGDKTSSYMVFYANSKDILIYYDIKTLLQALSLLLLWCKKEGYLK